MRCPLILVTEFCYLSSPLSNICIVKFDKNYNKCVGEILQGRSSLDTYMSPFWNHGHRHGVDPLSSYRSLYSSGKAFYKILDCVRGNLCQFSKKKKTIVRSGTVFWMRRPDSQSVFQCSVGVRPGLCTGQSSPSAQNSSRHVSLELAGCHRAQSCQDRKGPSPNTRLEEYNFLETLGLTFSHKVYHYWYDPNH